MLYFSHVNLCLIGNYWETKFTLYASARRVSKLVHSLRAEGRSHLVISPILHDPSIIAFLLSNNSKSYVKYVLCLLLWCYSVSIVLSADNADE